MADIYIAVPPDASDEQRSELKKKAEKVLTEALNTRKQRAGFGKLIKKYSDTPEKYKKGDTGYFDKEGNPIGLSAQIVEASFKLEKGGSITEHVIEAQDGYHVIMRTANRSAIERPLSGVSNQIKQRIRREGLKKEREAYINGLKEKQEISIDRKTVGEIAIRMMKPEKQPALQKPDTQTSRHGTSRTPPAFPGQQ